jgi:hypothetical protein
MVRIASGTAYRAELMGTACSAARVRNCGVGSVGAGCSFCSVFTFLTIFFKTIENIEITFQTTNIYIYIYIYSAFNQGGNREESVEPEQHFSRIAALTADSRMSH